MLAYMPGTAATRSLDIIDTLLGEGAFKKLIEAVKTAGLVDVLKGAGPYTLFAPMDEAFASLPAGSLQELEKPSNHEKLKKVLEYHIATGSHPAREVKTRLTLDTISGNVLHIESDGSGKKVDNARVVGEEIRCTNGIIHVIDQVLDPM